MRIGLSLGLPSAAATGRRRWSPASLSPLFWAGGFDPASGLMWQDSAGVTPVTAAEQPVGRMLSSAGAIAALQPTALSRPTLARWPKGGRRNLVTQSEMLGLAAWAKTPDTTASGNTVNFPGSTSHIGINEGRISQAVTVGPRLGRSFVMSLWLPPASEWSDSGAQVLFGASAGAPQQLTVSSTPLGRWESIVIAPVTATDNVVPAVKAQTALTVTGLKVQFEEGTVPTPYQKVTTANDVTEAGVPDVWHLFDDGGDSLLAVLPAGNLHLAYVNQLGAVSYSTATSDGTTGVDLLLAERMADVIVLDRAFTTDEEAKIEAYWARYAA